MTLWLILFTAYGACVGSFLNVVIYRIPAGRNIVSPPSACPECNHVLAWHDNVPVLGWIWLLGRCRYCRASISIQYPIIEAVTASMFGGLYVLYFHTDLRPEFVGLAADWPVLLVHLVLLASLIAASMIDAELYIIPLAIPRVLTVVGVVGLPLARLVSDATGAPSVNGWPVGAAAGGAAGLVVANALLGLGVIPRSFDEPLGDGSEADGADSDPNPDPDSDQAMDQPDDTGDTGDAGDTGDTDPPAEHDDEPPWRPWRAFGRELAFAGGLILIGVLIHITTGGTAPDRPDPAPRRLYDWRPIVTWLAAFWLACLLISIVWSAVASRRAARASAEAEPEDAHEHLDDWLDHPNPRGEILKEILFVAFPVLGAAAGAWLMRSAPALSPPWAVLAGAVFGYLVGGAVVWVTRIAGTLGFGKEAMGLGDVHLLAAIGAVMGWLDSIVIFFVAPFFGLLGAALLAALGRLLSGRARVIPYGPYLAIAAVVVLAFGGERLLARFGML